MKNKNLAISIGLIAFALTAMSLGGSAAPAPETNSGVDVELPAPVTTGGATMLIYNDWPQGDAAVVAADNLGIAFDTASQGQLSSLAFLQQYDTVVINSQNFALSASDPNIYQTFADYASGSGKIVFQSWDLDISGIWGATAGLNNLLDTLGASGPVSPHFSPPTVTTASQGLDCAVENLVPGGFLPLGMGTINPDQSPFGRDAQSVSVTTGQQCFETQGNPDQAQVVLSDNGVYVGFLAGSYDQGEAVNFYQTVYTSYL